MEVFTSRNLKIVKSVFQFTGPEPSDTRKTSIYDSSEDDGESKEEESSDDENTDTLDNIPLL